jgi:metal-sulfur cluster biosynthetic enzyme
MKDRKLLFQNPVLLMTLGIVPALAASTDLRAALGMSAAVMFVLLCSALVIGLLRKLIPAGAKLPAVLLTVAGCPMKDTLRRDVTAAVMTVPGVSEVQVDLGVMSDEQRTELTRWIEAKVFDRQEKIAAVTRIYDAIGIRQLCEEKINFYFNEARKYLDQVSVGNDRKQHLLSYMNEMMHRDK